MSMLNLPKRRLVDEVKLEVFEMKVNALSDAGYTMEAFAISPGFSGQDVGESYPSYVAVMKLKVDPSVDYRGMDDFCEIPLDKITTESVGRAGSPLVAKMLNEGWFIVALYSGKAVLGHRRIEKSVQDG